MSSVGATGAGVSAAELNQLVKDLRTSSLSLGAPIRTKSLAGRAVVHVCADTQVEIAQSEGQVMSCIISQQDPTPVTTRGMALLRQAEVLQTLKDKAAQDTSTGELTDANVATAKKLLQNLNRTFGTTYDDFAGEIPSNQTMTQTIEEEVRTGTSPVPEDLLWTLENMPLGDLPPQQHSNLPAPIRELTTAVEDFWTFEGTAVNTHQKCRKVLQYLMQDHKPKDFQYAVQARLEYVDHTRCVALAGALRPYLYRWVRQISESKKAQDCLDGCEQFITYLCIDPRSRPGADRATSSRIDQIFAKAGEEDLRMGRLFRALQHHVLGSKAHRNDWMWTIVSDWYQCEGNLARYQSESVTQASALDKELIALVKGHQDLVKNLSTAVSQAPEKPTSSVGSVAGSVTQFLGSLWYGDAATTFALAKQAVENC